MTKIPFLKQHTSTSLIFFLRFKFKIHCTETYKLAFVGSLDSIARFVALPLTGLFCDR